MTDKIYTFEEAGEYLRVSKRTVERLVESGLLRAFPLGSGAMPRRRISQTQIDDYVEQQMTCPNYIQKYSEGNDNE